MQFGGIDDLLFQRHVGQTSADMGIAHQFSRGDAQADDEPLIKSVAKKGLFALSRSALQLNAKEVGADIIVGESCLERCHSLIMHVLSGQA